MPDHPRAALPDAHEFIDLGDGVTHYRIDGADGAPTVLLLHGTAIPAWQFDRLVPHLVEAGLRCVSYDLYGHGYSSRPDRPISSALLLKQANEFIEALLPGQSFALLGHSLGSMVAAKLVLEQPARVTALAMASPVWRLVQPAPSAFLGLPGIGQLLVHSYVVPMLKRGISARYRDIEDGRYVRLFEQQLAFPGFGRSLLSLFRSGAPGSQASVYEALEASDIPLLMLRGAEEFLVSEGAFDDIRAKAPRTEVERIEGAAHAMLLTHPEQVASVLVAFLKRSLI